MRPEIRRLFLCLVAGMTMTCIVAAARWAPANAGPPKTESAAGDAARLVCRPAALALQASPEAAPETVPAASAASLSPYGVCAHLPRGDEYPTAREELELMRKAGIGWARADFSWSGVEPRRGQWRFDHLDHVVEWADRAGIRILPILDYDVDWARPAHAHLDLWREYVRRVVERYQDRIRYWEVWNEPNLEMFWKDKPDAAKYVELLKATHETIQRIDPELKVLLGGTAGIPWDYLEGIYAAGGESFFDVMNVHPYRYPDTPEHRSLLDDIDRLRKLMAAHGDTDKPIWFTEIGWPTHQGQRGISPEAQARMLARSYLISLQAGIEVVFWYEFQAPEHKADYNEDHFGMVHRDLTPKPAYEAMTALVRARPVGSRTLAGQWRHGPIWHPGWRRPDGRTAWALWRADGEAEASLSIDGKLDEVLDHLGRPVEPRRDEDRLLLRIGEGPVYLIGPERLKFAPVRP